MCQGQEERELNSAPKKNDSCSQADALAKVPAVMDDGRVDHIGLMESLPSGFAMKARPAEHTPSFLFFARLGPLLARALKRHR